MQFVGKNLKWFGSLKSSEENTIQPLKRENIQIYNGFVYLQAKEFLPAPNVLKHWQKEGDESKDSSSPSPAKAGSVNNFTGCSITVVRYLGVVVARVQFSAPRKKTKIPLRAGFLMARFFF